MWRATFDAGDLHVRFDEGEGDSEVGMVCSP
jgi:hypothetical protein